MTNNLSEVDRLNIKIRRLLRKNEKLKKQKDFYKKSLDNYAYVMLMQPYLNSNYLSFKQRYQHNFFIYKNGTRHKFTREINNEKL